MPSRYRTLGFHELVVPAYFVTDENDPKLAEWKQDHPDWFVAGTWSPGSTRSAGIEGVSSRNRRKVAYQPSPASRYETIDLVAAARPLPLPNSVTMSVREFLAIGAAHKGTEAGLTSVEASAASIERGGGEKFAPRPLAQIGNALTGRLGSPAEQAQASGVGGAATFSGSMAAVPSSEIVNTAKSGRGNPQVPVILPNGNHVP